MIPMYCCYGICHPFLELGSCGHSELLLYGKELHEHSVNILLLCSFKFENDSAVKP